MTKTAKIIIGIIIVVIVIAGIWYGISRKPAEKEMVKIGVALALTGNQASYGETIKKGIDLAIKEINASGGINGRKLQAVYEDHQGDTKLGISAYQKLVNIDGIKILFSAVSGPTLAMIKTAENDKTLLFAIGVATPSLSDAGDYIFRHNLLPRDEITALADFLYNQKGIKEIGLLTVNVEAGIGYRDTFKQIFEKLGGKIKITEMYEKGATDYKTQLIKIKQTGVKNAIGFSYSQEMGVILKQSKEINLDARWFSVYPIEDVKLLEIAGQAAEGLIYTHFFDSKMDSMKNYNENYYKEYKNYPNSFAALAYDNVKIISEVMKKCANPEDATCVKDELYKVKNFPGVTGKITFDQNGDSEKEIIFKTVKNGEFVKYEE